MPIIANGSLPGSRHLAELVDLAIERVGASVEDLNGTRSLKYAKAALPISKMGLPRLRKAQGRWLKVISAILHRAQATSMRENDCTDWFRMDRTFCDA